MVVDVLFYLLVDNGARRAIVAMVKKAFVCLFVLPVTNVFNLLM